jgi:hypothetical protein
MKVIKRYQQGPIVEGSTEQVITGEDLTHTEDWVETGDEVYDEQENGILLSLEKVEKVLQKIYRS